MVISNVLSIEQLYPLYLKHFQIIQITFRDLEKYHKAIPTNRRNQKLLNDCRILNIVLL